MRIIKPEISFVELRDILFFQNLTTLFISQLDYWNVVIENLLYIAELIHSLSSLYYSTLIEKEGGLFSSIGILPMKPCTQ